MWVLHLQLGGSGTRGLSSCSVWGVGAPRHTGSLFPDAEAPLEAGVCL